MLYPWLDPTSCITTSARAGRWQRLSTARTNDATATMFNDFGFIKTLLSYDTAHCSIKRGVLRRDGHIVTLVCNRLSVKRRAYYLQAASVLDVLGSKCSSTRFHGGIW